MKDALGLFIMIKRRLLRIYLQKMYVIIHTRNLQVRATEMLKVHKNMSTELMHGLFCVRQTHYNLRNPHHFAILSVKFFYHRSKSISDLGPRIWNLAPDRLKEVNSINSFENEIKRRQPEICPCRLCKTYIPRVGFL